MMMQQSWFHSLTPLSLCTHTLLSLPLFNLSLSLSVCCVYATAAVATKTNPPKKKKREFCACTYDLRTTLAMRGAGGCLTAKKGAWCGAVFVDLFHFLLLFVTFFYCL
jgi:hypothetical protein